MFYEILVYESEDDFAFNRSRLPQIDGIARKRDALREGKLWLAEFPIVKVQSSDREFISILKR